MIMKHFWNDNDTGETEALGRKRALLPLYSPQILHELLWDRTPFSEMRSRRLTASYKMFHCILNTLGCGEQTACFILQYCKYDFVWKTLGNKTALHRHNHNCDGNIKIYLMELGFMAQGRIAVFYDHGDGPSDFIRAANSRSDYIVLTYRSGVFRCTDHALL